MSQQDWLQKQQKLYETLPESATNVAIHPVSGEWQNSDYLKSRFWWGGGASQEALEQLPDTLPTDASLAVLTFGPVQTFLGAGQRLRDWAVASWLCHYLAAVVIHHWEDRGGHVLLPLHRSSPLIQWLKTGNCEQPDEQFWRAELPNVFTGIVPGVGAEADNWLTEMEEIVTAEWCRLIYELEDVVVTGERQKSKKLLDGVGWKVIQRDHQFLWSVYTESAPIKPNSLMEISATLHQRMEGRKLGRNWKGTWWGGKTSPTAGSLSVWHPGLQPIDRGGTWGIETEQLEAWWQRAAQSYVFRGLFGSEEQLNSLEFVKRLASVPEVIEPVLKRLWGHQPPACPWERFPDQTAIAAAWVPSAVPSNLWNEKLEFAAEYLQRDGQKGWGIPNVDRAAEHYIHPEVLERRNVRAWNPGDTVEDLNAKQDDWEELTPSGWTAPIQWTVGWRGDGDKMGQWLSGDKYKGLPWSRWHPNAEKIATHQLQINPPKVEGDRCLEMPHLLDISVLLSRWNQLLYPLVEECHSGKVIFAGGDDFLLLGSLPDMIPLTAQLHQLWSGQKSVLTQPLEPPVEGWVQYDGQIYPVPGQKMTFSLGIVIAQRRIPQSLWHRGLNEAYKKAKSAGRDRACIRVVFNSGQTLDWICPWPLWNLLMHCHPDQDSKTALNRWDKLLGYLQGVRLRQPNLETVQDLLTTLWQSVGLPLTWEQVYTIARRDFRDEVRDWQWWINWVSLRGFLARQERDRAQWLKQFQTQQKAS